MANVGYATLQVIPSFKGFSSKLRSGMAPAISGESAKAGEKAGKSFGSTFVKFAAVGAGALAAIHIGKGFVDAAVESQKVSKQTDAVLKSMGNQAGLTSKQIGDLATKQSLLSGVDDEVIQSAQNVLLTFGKVRNEVGKGNDIFNRGSQAALDMSVALKTDLQGATIQVGKALNDPIKGITALSRAGVSFTQQQKDQITTLTKSGKTLDAQKIILSELENQFGGSAKAQATAGEKLKVVFGNLQEQLGGYLLPAVEAVASFLAKNLPAAMEFAGRAIAPLVGGIKAFVATLRTGFTEDEGTPIERFALRVRAAIEGVVEFLKRNWPQIQKIVVTVAKTWAKVMAAQAAILFTKLIPALAKFAQWVAKNKPLLAALAVVIGGVLVHSFIAWTVATWAQVSAQLALAAAFIAANAPLILITAAVAALAAGFVYAYTHSETFRKIVDGIAHFIRDVAIPVFLDLLGKIKTVFLWVKDNWPLLLAIITGPFGLAALAIARNWDTIKAGATAVYDWVSSKIGAIAGIVTGLASAIATAGTTLWDGLSSGLGAVVSGIKGGLNRLVDFLLGIVNTAIAIYNAIPLVDNINKVSRANAVDTTANDAARAHDIGTNTGLATGGIVMPRFGGVTRTLAEAGNREAVIPLTPQGLRPFATALAPMVNGGRNNEQVLRFAGGADSRIASALVALIRTDNGFRNEMRTLAKS